MASNSNDTQNISYRELFQVQFSSLKEKLDDLKSTLKEMSQEVVTKDDFRALRDDVHEKVQRVELQAHGLQESLDELERMVRANEREIAIYKWAMGITGGIVVPVFLNWLKNVLGL